jgi:hypothetical protein
VPKEKLEKYVSTNHCYPSERTSKWKRLPNFKGRGNQSARRRKENGNYQYQDKAKTRELSGIVRQ